MYVECRVCDWEGDSEQLRRVGSLHVCPKCGQMHELYNEDGELLDPEALKPEKH